MADKRSSNSSKAGQMIQPRHGPANSSSSRRSSSALGREEPRARDGKTRSPRARKRKRRLPESATEKLPTPPPDPRLQPPKQRDKSDHYPDSHPRDGNYPEASSSSSPRPSVSSSAAGLAEAFAGTEEAFQHLDRLHSVLEQILELRHRNARLFSRVRELERLRASRRLEESTRRSLLLGELDPFAPEEDTGFASSLLSAMLAGSLPAAGDGPPRARRAPSFRQRSRSIGSEAQQTKRSSCQLQFPAAAAAASGSTVGAHKSSKRNSLVGSFAAMAPRSGPKISKWTKVKAAFKWERAGLGSGNGSALGNVVVEAMEHEAAAKFLRLPEAQDTTATTTTTTTATLSTTTLSGSSPVTAEHSGPPSPRTLSSTSSLDDLSNGDYKRIYTGRNVTRDDEEDTAIKCRSMEGEFIIPQNIVYVTQNSRDGVSRRLEKNSKTPWGMVKNIIQSRRDNVRGPVPRNSVRSDDGNSLSSHESSDMIHEIVTSEHNTKSRLQIVTSSETSSVILSSPKPSSPTATSTTTTTTPSTPSHNGSEIVDLASRRLTPTLTITVPSSEELRSVSSPESISPAASLRRPRQQQPQPDSNSTDDGRPPSAELPGESPYRALSTSAVASPRPPASRLQRQDSKWNKVKRAFLSGASSVPPSPSRISSFFDETDGGGSYSASAEDLDNNGGVSPTTQADIQRNYQILHDKLSMEFHRKLNEWDKLKNGQINASPTTRTSRVPTSPRDKDSANVLLMGEEQLTPEFKKKLQEWKRLKKGNPSGATSPEHQSSRRRLTDWQIWRTPAKTEGRTDNDSPGKINLSEDFLKKMEEWKKIKSGRFDEEQRRDSAEIYQMYNTSQRWKQMDEKEFQPLDKVIAMIEKEQQRVQKHREKLLNEMLRANELCRILDLMPEKREVLVHTSSGFYRFEGISQEFTKKLYEWEKSQGIAPEFSTLQLLNPAYKVSDNDRNAKSPAKKGSKAMQRSKSMSSVVENSVREETPIRQPSSLSLNDVASLENEGKLQSESKQTIGEEEILEELALDDSEPEAVIVDIEDVIEETASPMAKFQPQQTPVYCVTASETTSIAIPLGTVTASHEPSPVILIQAGETHSPRVEKHGRFSQYHEEKIEAENIPKNYSNSLQSAFQKDTHETSDTSNEEHRKRLFEPSDIKICETIIEEDISSSFKGEESDSDTETSSVEIEDDAESFKDARSQKSITSSINVPMIKIHENNENFEEDKVDEKDISLKVNITEIECKTDETLNTTLLKPDYEAKEVNDEETKNNGDILQNRIPESHNTTDEDAAIITVSSDIRPKKVLKTRRLTDTQVGYKWQQSAQPVKEVSPEPTDSLTVSTYPETPSVEKIILNESTLNKIIVPTASNEQLSNIVDSIVSKKSQNSSNTPVNVSEDESYCRRLNLKSESKSVFVKTKRIIFSPFSRRNSKDKAVTAKDESETTTSETTSRDSSESPFGPARSPKLCTPTNGSDKLPDIQRSKSSPECPVSSSNAPEKRPPLPQSPVLSRKEYRRSSPKETAPSIRMMIQRYNQKLQEDASSPASSGSGSPIWRSPTSERRVRAQMERYQEEVRRAISGSSPRSRLERDQKSRLEKSASAGLIRPPVSTTSAATINPEIVKSTSADSVGCPRYSVRSKPKEQADKAKCTSDRGKSAQPKSPADEAVAGEKRKNSLKNAEIVTNIKQSLVQEHMTLPIKNDADAEKRNALSLNFLEFGNEESPKDERKSKKLPGKISPELIDKLNALSNAPSQLRRSFYGSADVAEVNGERLGPIGSENSTPLRVRAQRMKKAKDEFFSRGASCRSCEPGVELYRQPRNSAVLEDLGCGGKSASAGMINVDSRTYERLSTSPGRQEQQLQQQQQHQQQLQQLPRAEKACAEIAGTFSKIASKFRRAKLKRGKDKEGKMSTVSMLCRQSLLVDIQAAEMSKSCPTSPSPQRDEDDYSRFKQNRDSN